jgi:hypothetical protein
MCSIPVGLTREATPACRGLHRTVDVWATRFGCVLPASKLLAPLDLLGSGEVVNGIAGLCLEAGREAEGGEEVDVEEVVMPDDPIV